MNRNGLEWIGMSWNDIKGDFDRNINRIWTGLNELEWAGMSRNGLEWIGMGCNDIRGDFDSNINRIGMGWNELEWNNRWKPLQLIPTHSNPFRLLKLSLNPPLNPYLLAPPNQETEL